MGEEVYCAFSGIEDDLCCCRTKVKSRCDV